MKLSDMPDVLTVTEAAGVLRIGRNTAYEMARRNVLPTVSFGRRVVVPKQALLSLLECGASEGDAR